MRILPQRLGSFALSLILSAVFGVLNSPLSAQCTVTCPANITTSNNPNQCGAVVNYPAPTTVSCDTVTCSPPSGSFFPRGTTTITCTGTNPPPPAAKEPAGGGRIYQPTNVCNFTVTVNDTQPPTITCPANITRSNDPNQCGAVSTYPPPTVSDNCPGVGAPVCSPASGSFFPVGITTTTCSTADGSGNTATCSFTNRVNDTQPPLITAPPDLTTGLCPPANIPNGTLGNPTVSDNCPGVTFTRLGLPPGNNFPSGTTIITYHATDASSNTADATQRVTVSTAHRIHGHISTHPPTHIGNVSHEHHGQHGHIVPAPSCPPHVPGHSAAAQEDVAGEMTSPPDFVAPLNADGTRVPARRGVPLALFGSAGDFYVGDQEEWPAANFAPPASGELLYYTTRLPGVSVGGVNAQVLFSGLAPGLPGVWQINILIPGSVAAGSNVPVVIRYAGEDLNATVTVE